MNPAVVYDRHCSFCRRQIANIQKLNRQKTAFEYVANDEEDLLHRYPSLTAHIGKDGLRFVDEQGSSSIGADAVHEIAKRLPYFFWVGWLYPIPPITWLGRKLYDAIAKRRYRLAQNQCEDGTCRF